ncbi:MAG: hypothetical protein KME47_10095 [Nodosilinea sp. WJT8-NPBG4]|jgi:hypothetical protein|nr:hypothetical protein [Nodosilinea sp. WJT8-NPBG4]
MDYFNRAEWMRDSKLCHTFEIIDRKALRLADGTIDTVTYLDNMGVWHNHEDCQPLLGDIEAMSALITATANQAASSGCMATLAELTEFKEIMPFEVVKDTWLALPAEIRAKITEMSKSKALAVAR